MRRLPSKGHRLTQRWGTSKIDSQYHWHILGAGSIGCLFASKLAEAKVPATLLLSSEKAVREFHLANSSIVLEENGKIQRFPLQAETGTSTNTSPITNLLVTTKAPQAANAVLSLRQRLNANSTLVLLHNGLGVYEQLEAELDSGCLITAITTQGAYRRSSFHVVHAGRGLTTLGRPDGGQMPESVSRWQSCDFDWTWTDNIRPLLIKKLAVNSCINPLTAFYRCRNGALLDGSEREAALEALAIEVSQVLSASGWTELAATLSTDVKQVCRNTGANNSSMLVDVNHGRATEIDFINGYLVRLARDSGVETPLNRKLIDDVWAMLPAADRD